ncbi:hypothetical protein KCP70_05690 [Salmonella enterica subsp. enterica]|nr:hypothetical protein KCP70_05690 [Salmonella enterica subsp. enterica]
MTISVLELFRIPAAGICYFIGGFKRTRLCFKFREAKRQRKPKTSKGEQPRSIEEKKGSSLRRTDLAIPIKSLQGAVQYCLVPSRRRNLGKSQLVWQPITILEKSIAAYCFCFQLIYD